MNKEAVEEFTQLLELTDELMGPDGCLWDRAQTFSSVRECILEEVYEVLDAIDSNDDSNLIEELGDLFYNVIFYCKLAEKEGRFTAKDALFMIREKLIARHPHVFGENKLSDAKEIMAQWEAIKKREKPERSSLLDGIPKELPALARAEKIAKKLKEKSKEELSEQELGEQLWEVVRRASHNPEVALRKFLMEKEAAFRANEQTSAS